MRDTTRRNVLAGVGGGSAAALLGGTATASRRRRQEGDDGEQSEAPGAACVNFAHLSPDLPSIDLYVNDKLWYGGYQFGEVNGYATLLAGTHNLKVVPAFQSPETAVLNVDAEFPEGEYTFAIVGEATGETETPVEGRLFQDDIQPIEENRTRVRFLHASPDTSNVDLLAAGGETPVFEGIGYGEAGYVDLPGRAYAFELRSGDEVISAFSLDLENRWRYTSYLTGYSNPLEAPVYQELNVGTVIDAAAPLEPPEAPEDPETPEEPEDPDDPDVPEEPEEPVDDPDEPTGENTPGP